MKKRAFSFVLIIFMIAMLIPQGIMNQNVHAATFNDINQSDVFLKQTESRTCTLVAATMIIRRAAILQGDPDWKSITVADVRKVAWADGLNPDFTYKHNGISYRIVRGNLPRHTSDTAENKPTLISLLKAHPEGISIYRNYYPQHFSQFRVLYPYHLF